MKIQNASHKQIICPLSYSGVSQGEGEAAASWHSYQRSDASHRHPAAVVPHLFDKVALSAKTWCNYDYTGTLLLKISPGWANKKIPLDLRLAEPVIKIQILFQRSWREYYEKKNRAATVIQSAWMSSLKRPPHQPGYGQLPSQPRLGRDRYTRHSAFAARVWNFSKEAVWWS